MKPPTAYISPLIKPKVVIVLFILAAAAISLGTLIPQIGSASPAFFEHWRRQSPRIYFMVDLFQLNQIFTSGWFLTLACIIELALGYSIFRQFVNNIRKKQGAPPSAACREAIPCATPPSWDRIAGPLKSRGYSPQHQDETFYLFAKHPFARWGSLILHSGLFLLITAGFIHLTFQQRGFAQIIEGRVSSGREEMFLSTSLGLLQKRFDPGFQTLLNKFTHSYWDTGSIKEINSSILLFDDSGSVSPREETVAVNHPVTYKGVRIHQSYEYGYTVSFMLTKPGGKSTLTHFPLYNPDTPGAPWTGGGGFAKSPYFFTIQLFPSLSRKSPSQGHPILYLRVSRPGAGQVFDGLLPPGKSILLDGNLLQFFRLSWWSGLIYEKGSDMPVAYAGFGVICLGAMLMFFFSHREIYVTMQDSEIKIAGWTKRDRLFFNEELAEIKKDIARLC